MLEKLSQLAAKSAQVASRRRLLGRLGRGAMALAAVAAGLLTASRTEGGPPPSYACGPNSARACEGKVAGAPCNVGYRTGFCIGPPNCRCQLGKDPRRPR